MNETIRLALVITELEVGGAERCLVNLATGLDRRQFSPVVYSLGPQPQPPRQALVDQLRTAEIPTHFIDVRSTWQFPVAVGRLRKLLIAQRPEIIQTFLFHANIVGALAARLRPRPALVHGMRVADPARWRLAAERRLNRRVDRVTCVSQSVADFYATWGQIPANKLVVIPNGIEIQAGRDTPAADLTELGVPAARAAITFVGRLHAQKGLDWLLRIMPQVLAERPDVSLLLVGQGPEQARLESLAASLNLADRVHFAGWRPDVASVLRASRLLVLPSRWEGMPNVVLEAMAAEKPVVSTRAEGVVELLGDAATQQTAAMGDDEDFVRKLVSLLDNPTSAAEIGRRNRQRVTECFSLDRMIQSYQQLYLSLRR